MRIVQYLGEGKPSRSAIRQGMSIIWIVTNDFDELADGAEVIMDMKDIPAENHGGPTLLSETDDDDDVGAKMKKEKKSKKKKKKDE